jgi:hypothetical protein
MPADDAWSEQPHAVAFHPDHPLPGEIPLEEERESEEKRQRRLRLVGLILTILAGIVVLLLTQCSEGRLNTSGDSSRTIGTIEGVTPLDGSVSVWVKPGERITAVVRSADVRVNGMIDLGDGRYVLGVRDGTEQESIAALKALDSVSDAGYVYPDAKSAAGDSK